MGIPELFDGFFRAPGMFVAPVNFGTVTAFIQGADCASRGGYLNGFREWLVVKVGYANNLAWDGLVLQLAFPKSKNAFEELKTPTAHEQAISLAFQLLREFYESADHDQIRRIYLEHEGWLRGQSWYKPDWPGWIKTWADKN